MKNPASKTALATASIALALSGFAAPAANAGHEDSIIEITHRLEDLVSELREEFGIHYRHTSAYRHLLADAARMEAEVDHIHRLAHDPYGSLRHLREDVEDLDDLAHHLHELVDATERDRYGHVHGDTRHVHELLTALNRVIHALEDEIDDIARSHAPVHGGYYDHGPVYSRGCPSEGITFSRGGFRISFFR